MTEQNTRDLLRAPFPADAVKFKIQANPRDDNGSAVIAAYIDARDAMARLDTVTPGRWADDYEVVPGFALICRITVDGITRADATALTGEATDMAVKGAFSDAFKRAAVKFGVGASLYALKAPRLKATVLHSYTRRDGKKVYSLSDANLAKLRAGYEKWLEANEQQWGAPLGVAAVIDDHAADEDRSAGPASPPPTSDAVVEAPPATEDPDPREPAAPQPQTGTTITNERARELVRSAVGAGIEGTELHSWAVELHGDLPAWTTRQQAIDTLARLTPEQAAALHDEIAAHLPGVSG